MSRQQEDVRVETKAEAEALIPLFKFERVLNQDQNGRRITLLGMIKSEPASFTLERAAFPSDANIISSFLSTLSNTTNLGTNDVYRWYMSNHSPSPSSPTSPPIPDLKLNLIYPCTPTHIQKYTSQPLRYVTETPHIYAQHIKDWIDRTQRTPKRLDWIYNILDGLTEQEDVIYRSPDYDSTFTSTSTTASPSAQPLGFLLLPDLNWDRKTLTGLHLLALIQRRDISSLRDLKRSHLSWLKTMLDQIRTAAAKRGSELAAANNGSPEPIDPDQIKCYIHYHPTYYHFHVHVVHVMLEPEGSTQSVGKAIGLETIVSLLEGLNGVEGQDPGLDKVDISYFVGEETELWKRCFGRLKRGESVDLGE